MNPLPLAAASLRRRPWTALTMVLLVALATGLGTGVGMLERGLRRGAAGAADPFGLLVGAPGSQAQLVLTAIYLQPDAVPLLPGPVLRRLQAEPGVAWVSPIGFGDSWRSHPVVGVAPAFATLGGRRALAEGRVFAAEDEAVAGAAVPLPLGGELVPRHGLGRAGGGRPDEDGEEEHAHEHGDLRYRIVGRLPPTGTPWDWAVLVPIETVWGLHGLGNGHAPGVERVGPPWDGDVPGVPAAVAAPRGVADAYALRARYRAENSMALFPAEVLISLFRIAGNLREVLAAMALACAALVLAAVFLAFGGLLAARTREFAVLRALGAPHGFVLLTVWTEMAAVLVAGVVAGLGLGWAGAALAAGVLGRAARLSVVVAPGWSEAALAASVLFAGLLAALLPALLAWRRPPGEALKR